MRVSIKIILIIAVLAIALLFKFFPTDAFVVNYPSNGKDIIAFGDSLVYGEGSKMGGGFVKMLSEDLGVPIVNLGINGNTTKDGLNRINTLDQYNPKVVILLLGGNDFLRKIPEEEAFRNIEKLIQEIQKRGAVVLLIGLRGQILGNRHDKYFESLVEKYHTAYVPNILSGILTNPKLRSDSIHPNDEGYRLMANRIKPVLEPLLTN